MYRKWYSLRLGRHAAEEEGHQCWSLLAAALRARPDVHCSWTPSHRTAKEAAKLAIPEAWHRGNEEADERAKQASLARDLPAVLLASHVANRAVAEKLVRDLAPDMVDIFYNIPLDFGFTCLPG